MSTVQTAPANPVPATMRAQLLSAACMPLMLDEQRPTPALAADEVLIRVHACGVCGSDLHLVDGEFEGYARTPIVPGHEIAGTIAAVGERVTRFRTGDRVGLGWTQATCGQCRHCRRGETAICQHQLVTGIQVDGGWAEYVKAPARDVVALPDAISFADAAPLFCAGLTTFTPFRLAGFRPGRRCVVLGLGGLGHMAVQWSHVLGGETVLVARGAEKAQLARQLGADEAIDSTATDWVQRVAAMGGADLVLATANSPQLMTEAFRALGPDGTLVLLAVDGTPLTLPSSMEFVGGRKRVMGSTTGSLRDVEEMLALAVSTGVRPMIETHPLRDASLALDRVRQGAPRFRAVLQVAA